MAGTKGVLEEGWKRKRGITKEEVWRILAKVVWNRKKKTENLDTVSKNHKICELCVEDKSVDLIAENVTNEYEDENNENNVEHVDDN